MLNFKTALNNKDFEVIAELAKTIWTEHYTPIIGIEQVKYMLDKFQSQKAIKKQVMDDNYIYYILSNESIAIGYISIKKNDDTLFLSKLYIDKLNRGKGFGKLAMNFIEELAKNLNCNKIFLTVNKYNTNSIKTYKKVGFNIIEELVIDIGNGFIMDDFKMEKLI